MSVAIEWPVVSDDPAIQGFYERCRIDGVAHSLAEMFAFQSPPTPHDDTTWLRLNSKNIGGHENPFIHEAYTAPSRELGLSTSGSVYMPSIADFPGDPKAWVKNESELKQRQVERGGGWSDGTQVVRARNDVEPEADIDVAPDIVEQRVMDMMDANPELKATPEVFEQAKDSIAPHWVK